MYQERWMEEDILALKTTRKQHKKEQIKTIYSDLKQHKLHKNQYNNNN